MTRWLEQQASVRERRGLVRTPLVRTPLGPSEPGRPAVDRTEPARPAVDLASNDYLGLANDPRLAQAAAEAAHSWGTGATSSRLVVGTTELHLELERELALLTGMESALVFSSGYLANVGVLTALGGPGTLVLADEHCHASLVDGFRLSRSRAETFPHNDISSLDVLLSGRQEPRALIAVESVYSVLGDAAPLEALLAVAERHDAVLLVDEAHSLGVAGSGTYAGHGSVAGTALAGHPNVVLTATLSKALGSQGGAVMGSALLREHLVNRARSFIFDTGLAPTSTAAALAALRILREEPWRPTAVRTNALAITAGVAAVVERNGGRSEVAAGAVQSIPVPSAEAALAASRAAHDAGVLVGCFRPPSVRDGISRLRLTARATLTAAEIDHSCAVLRKILEDLP